MSSPERDRDPDRPEDDHTLASPYGPQYGHVDEAAGGADSSPFETIQSGEKLEEAIERRHPKTTGEGED